MIFKILKNYSYGNIGKAIDYHEKKVKKGVATKDYMLSSMSMNSGTAIADTLSSHMKLNNPGKRGAHFHHISANFPKEDNVSLEVKRQVVMEYLKGMGYDSTLHCAYRHSDKAHDHWHVFATASNIEGKLIDTRDDHIKSVKVSRALEKAYGLRTLRSSKEEKSESLDVDNFRYARGLAAYQKLVESRWEEPEKYFELAFQHDGQRMTNEELRGLYKKNGAEDSFRKMIGILSTANLIEPSRRSLIWERARKVKKEAKDLAHFVELFNDESQGFYARYLANKHEITYGFQSLYIDGPKLSKEFSAIELKKYWNEFTKTEGKAIGNSGEDQEIDFYQVKKFVRSRIQRLIYYSDSFEDLSVRLNQEDIIPDLVIRKDGNSSLTFTHMGYKIKSSAMKLDYKSICGKIESLKEEQQTFLKNILKERVQRKIPKGGKQVLNSAMFSLSGNSKQAANEEENEQKYKYRNRDL